jgi:hypothetical protein
MIRILAALVISTVLITPEASWLLETFHMVLGPSDPGLFPGFAPGQIDVFPPALNGLKGIDPFIDKRQLIGCGGIVGLKLQSPFELITGLIVGAFEQQRQAQIIGEDWIRAMRELGTPQRGRGGRKVPL